MRILTKLHSIFEWLQKPQFVSVMCKYLVLGIMWYGMFTVALTAVLIVLKEFNQIIK